MLSYNEIKRGRIIVYNGEPYKVLESEVAKRTKQKPVNQTKLKSLISGNVVNESFHQNDSVEEALLEKRELRFEYQKRDEVWFVDPENPKERINLSLEDVEHELQFIRPGDTVMALYFEDNLIGIDIPVKVVLEVTEAPPNIKGNTASGGNKKVVLETGLVVDAPLFIETGDSIEVNTETSSYSTRVSK